MQSGIFWNTISTHHNQFSQISRKMSYQLVDIFECEQNYMFICNCLSFQQLGYMLRCYLVELGCLLWDPALNMMRPADAFEAKGNWNSSLLMFLWSGSTGSNWKAQECTESDIYSLHCMDSTLLTDLIVLLLSVMPRQSVNLFTITHIGHFTEFLRLVYTKWSIWLTFLILIVFLTCFHPDILVLIILKAKEKYKNNLQRHNDKGNLHNSPLSGPSGLEKSSGN